MKQGVTPSQPEHPRERPRQFSLAWLIFWTLICAVGAGIARLFVERGPEGIDNLIILVAVVIWLGITWLAMLHRVFARRRWEQVNARRSELEAWSRTRLQQVKQRPEAGDSPPTQP